MFQEFPISDDTLTETATRPKAAQLQKTAVGQETVDGYPCTKTIVVVSEANHAPEKAIVWFASDLKEFPVRMAWGKNNALQAMEFKNVQLTSPNPTLFEIPTNYTRLENTAAVFRVAKELFQASGGQLSTPPKNGKSSD